MDAAYTKVWAAFTDHSDLVTVWNTAREAFGPHYVPSNLSGVTVLGYEYQVVEIEAVAALSKKVRRG